jgi:hypothetical protein
MENNQSNATKAGTAGGTLFALLHIHADQMLETAMLAGIGAAVSFTVTLVLRWLIKSIKGKQ